MDFGDLKNDKSMQQKLLNFNKSVTDIDKLIEVAFNGVKYDDLPIKDKLNFDLFIAYTLNTLYWMYLRSKGVDPNSNDVKTELGRIRDYMIKSKSATERHTLRPKLNTEVADRFIKHGIEHPKDKPSTGVEDVEEATTSKFEEYHWSSEDEYIIPKRRRT